MLGLGISLARGAFASIITYVKDGLKLFYNFTEHQDNPISHASTGSTSFDGTDDYVSSTSFAPNLASDMTSSMWVYVNDATTEQTLIGFNDATLDRWTVQIRVNEIQSNCYNGTAHNASGAITVGWHHMAIVWDSTAETSYLYIDGVLQVGTVTCQHILGVTDTVLIGSDAGTYPLDGKICNVGIWSRALSASEVQGIMYKQYSDLGSVEKTSLVSWWGLDEESLGDEMVTGTDSDFTGAGNWSTVNAVATPNYDSGDEGHSSTMRIEANDGTNDRAELAVAQWDDSPVIGGQYQVSVEYKYINNDGSPTTKLSMLGVNKSLDSSNTEWTSYTDTIVAVDDSTQFRFYVSQTGGTADNEVLIDNLSIRPYVVEDLEGSNDGTIVGATTTTGYTSSPHGVVDPTNYGTLKSGTALSFDGTNDYVDCANSLSDISGLSEGSVLVWFKMTTSQRGTIISASDSGDGSSEFELGVDVSGTPRVGVLCREGGTILTGLIDIDISDNNWHQFAYIVDGNGNTMYLDGKAQSVTYTVGNSSTQAFYNNVNDLDAVGVGSNKDSSGQQWHFNGSISNVKIFNSVLTESEIQEMYLNPEQILPTGVSSSNLKLHLPMNEGDGDYTYDGSGNQNHGTISGATWDTANTDIAQVGLVRQNKPMVFDGSDDYVDMGDVEIIAGTSYSMSIWFKTGTSGAYQGLLSKRTPTEVSSNWGLWVADTDKIRYSIHTGSGWQDLYSDNTVATDTWYNVVITRDGTTTKVYLNGSLDGSTTDIALSISGTSESFFIGNSGQSEYFDGLINEVAIWDEALDADAVTALYNSGTPLDVTADSGNYDNSGDLQGYWRNDGDTTWTDRTPLGAYGSELVTNGTFDADVSGWTQTNLTATYNSGTAVITNQETANDEFLQSVSLDEGVGYEVSATISNYSAGSSTIVLRYDNTALTSGGSGGDRVLGTVDGNKTITAIIYGTSGTETLRFRCTGTGSATNYTIDNVSVKKYRGGNDGTVSGSPDSIVLTEGLTSGRDSQGFYLTDTTENCLTLNGAEYVEIPDSEALDFGQSNFSIEYWINTSESTNVKIINQWDYSGTTTVWASSSFESRLSSNKFYARVSNGSSGVDVTSTTSINDGDWHHIVFLRDGDTLRLYVDKTQEDTGDVTGITIPDTTRPIWIGKDVSSANIFFNGLIDDVRIYSKALSSDEVTKNYNAGKSKH